MSKTHLPESFRPYLEGSLQTGVVIDGVRYRLAKGLDDWSLIRGSEDHWEPEHRLPEKNLIADAPELQILALSEGTGGPIGRCSSVRVRSEADVHHVPNWQAFYDAEGIRRIQAIESGNVSDFTRFEGTGVIVDPERRGEGIGMNLMVFMVRGIAERLLKIGRFDSFTWSIHNPGYRAWLGERDDSPELHQHYIASVVRDELNDPVLTPYLKSLNILGKLEYPEGLVAQTPGGLVRILNCNGGCVGYEESCCRGVRVDATELVRAFAFVLTKN